MAEQQEYLASSVVFVQERSDGRTAGVQAKEVPEESAATQTVGRGERDREKQMAGLQCKGKGRVTSSFTEKQTEGESVC